MRTLAMADGVGGEAPGLITAVATTGGAMIGGFALWLANRLMGRAAFQTAINDGFAKLVQEVQEERDVAKRERDAFKSALEAERIAWAEERAHLQGELRNVMQVVESLKRLLVRAGIEIPEPPGAIGREAQPGAIILGDKPKRKG